MRMLMNAISRRGVLVGVVAALGGCALLPGPAPVMSARVEAQDSSAFVRNADGAWIELGKDGLARYRFIDERQEGDVSILFDETRHVRLRLDPAAMTLTEETPQGWRALYTLSGVTRGQAPRPAEDAAVTRVWLEGGGAFVRRGEAWTRLSDVDGMAMGGDWLEIASGENRLLLARGGEVADVDFGSGRVTISSPGAPAVDFAIRALDRG